MRQVERPRIVITRSRDGNTEFAQRLSSLGFDPIPIDSIVFLPPLDWSAIDTALRRLSSFDWVVFTSTTGVKFFGERLKALHLPAAWSGKPKVAAVGEGTSREISKMGVAVNFIPSRYLTESLGAELPLGEGTEVLLLRADIANPKLAKVLRERGFTVREHPIYRTTHPSMEIEGLSRADAVAFASSSAVEGVCSALPERELANLKEKTAFCIGPVTANAARLRGFRNTVVPRTYTFDGLLEEIRRMVAVA